MNEIEILQFGTGRFLQAHVDFILHQAAADGQPVGKVAVLQSSNQEAGKKRAAALRDLASYPVRIEGYEGGRLVEETHQVSIIHEALVLSEQWDEAIKLVRQKIKYIISNTADRGYELFESDSPTMRPPASFPAKLLLLLKERFDSGASAITILPCELVPGNGDLLQSLVLKLAIKWQFDEEVIAWLQKKCIWVNTLVDRIVSGQLEPVGAVAEPYVLWAIQKKEGFIPPCSHPAIKVVEDLYPFELMKLGILNLSHTFLVDHWVADGKPQGINLVKEIIAQPRYLKLLKRVLDEEVIPTIKALIPGEDPVEYTQTVLERFQNPFLDHELTAIYDNHQAKLERRLQMIREHSRRLFPEKATPLLDECLSRNGM